MQKVGLLEDGCHLVAISSDEALAVEGALRMLDDVLTIRTEKKQAVFHVEPEETRDDGPEQQADGAAKPSTPARPAGRKPATRPEEKVLRKPTLVSILGGGKSMSIEEIYQEFLRINGMEPDPKEKARIGVALATYPESFERVRKGVYRKAKARASRPARRPVERKEGPSEEDIRAKRKAALQRINEKLNSEE